MSAITGTGAGGPNRANEAASVARPQASPEAGPLDAERAERLRAALAAGQYPVDPQKLAERLVALGLFPASPQ